METEQHWLWQPKLEAWSLSKWSAECVSPGSLCLNSYSRVTQQLEEGTFCAAFPLKVMTHIAQGV